jgi:hypothetical protein
MGEAFPTVSTNKGFFAGMNANMLLKKKDTCEGMDGEWVVALTLRWCLNLNALEQWEHLNFRV